MKCSFCGKDQSEVRQLFADKKVNISIDKKNVNISASFTPAICDECVFLCADILAEKGVERKTSLVVKSG